MSTGIIVALPEELSTLTTQKLHAQQAFSLNTDTIVILSGIGAYRAHKAAQHLLRLGVDKIISWGCAGGIAPHLDAGDLIIPRRIYTPEQTFIPAAKWRQSSVNHLAHSFKISQDALLHSAVIIKTTQEKQRLQHTYQAAAVDMESASIARVALSHNIPFIVLRSIVDPAHFSLPPTLNKAMTAQGTVSLTALFHALIAHPRAILPLLQLSLYFYAAKRCLTQVATQLPHITSLI